MIDYLGENSFETDENQFLINMFYYDRIDISEGIDLANSNSSKECMVCQNCFFNHWFKFQDSI